MSKDGARLSHRLFRQAGGLIYKSMFIYYEQSCEWYDDKSIRFIVLCWDSCWGHVWYCFHLRNRAVEMICFQETDEVWNQFQDAVIKRQEAESD